MSQYTTTASGQGAIMSVTGTGDTTVTTSNGVATVTSGSGNANSVIDWVDDFLGPTPFEIWDWNSSQITFQTASISGHPGIFSLNGSTSWFQMSCRTVGGGSAIGPIILGSGVLTLVWYVNLVQLSTVGNPYNVYIGLSNDASTGSVPTSGLWFTYTNSLNSGNWQIVSSKASVVTTANTTVAADTNWHRFKIIVNSTGTSASFFIDDVQVANSPLSTNIPTIGIGPTVLFNQVAGAGTPFIDLDLVTLNLVLNTPR